MYSSKALCHSKILDICRKKVASLELLLKDKSNIDMEERNNWKLNLEKYKNLEKKAEDNLEKENKIHEKAQFKRNDKKKETKKEDIFSDPAFLEF